MVQAAIKGKIVIVDDNDMTRALLRGLLVSEGYMVVGEANNGDAGFEMILRIRPDLVCLDVNMPRTDGLTVLKQVRDQLPDQVVVMVTGNTDRDTVQGAITGGAAGFIVKPFNSAKVLSSIEAAMKKVVTHPRVGEQGLPVAAPVAAPEAASAAAASNASDAASEQPAQP